MNLAEVKVNDLAYLYGMCQWDIIQYVKKQLDEKDRLATEELALEKLDPDGVPIPPIPVIALPTPNLQLAIDAFWWCWQCYVALHMHTNPATAKAFFSLGLKDSEKNHPRQSEFKLLANGAVYGCALLLSKKKAMETMRRAGPRGGILFSYAK
jgi:hypothetical protein